MLQKGLIIKPNQSKNKQISDEKAQERELWFKTVVKVISWKEGPGEKKQVLAEKITSQEWISYCKQTIKINASTLKSKTQKKLQEVEELIKKHGGFA